MLYQVSRNGQTYGPYTLDDLKRYIASGNVLPTDLAKSEEMAEWIPVSALLSGEPAAPSTGAAPLTPPTTPHPTTNPYSATPDPAGPYPPVSAALAQSPFPDPPALNWGLVLLFAILTCSLFMYIWNLVVAAWLKRVQPNATSLFYYIAAGVLAVVQGIVSLSLGLGNFAAAMHGAAVMHQRGLGIRILLGVVVWVVRLVARFQQRESLLEHFNGPEPVGLQLSGVMTFFFGGLYFQYHLNRINEMKQAARYGAPRF